MTQSFWTWLAFALTGIIVISFLRNKIVTPLILLLLLGSASYIVQKHGTFTGYLSSLTGGAYIGQTETIQ